MVRKWSTWWNSDLNFRYPQVGRLLCYAGKSVASRFSQKKSKIRKRRTRKALKKSLLYCKNFKHINILKPDANQEEEEKIGDLELFLKFKLSLAKALYLIPHMN